MGKQTVQIAPQLKQKLRKSALKEISARQKKDATQTKHKRKMTEHWRVRAGKPKYTKIPSKPKGFAALAAAYKTVSPVVLSNRLKTFTSKEIAAFAAAAGITVRAVRWLRNGTNRPKEVAWVYDKFVEMADMLEHNECTVDNLKAEHDAVFRPKSRSAIHAMVPFGMKSAKKRAPHVPAPSNDPTFHWKMRSNGTR